jgi:long-chain acyl-CoA synthetase
MIISGGVNVYPQEIEAVIRVEAVIRETPGVWDCAVVGVPDERFGERPVAFVVADRSGATDMEALVAAVRARCEQNLGRFKQPTQIQVIPQLPRSATGKLLRRQLRELVSAQQPTTSRGGGSNDGQG